MVLVRDQRLLYIKLEMHYIVFTVLKQVFALYGHSLNIGSDNDQTASRCYSALKESFRINR